MWNLHQDNAFSQQMSWIFIPFLGSTPLHACHPQPLKPALCNEWTAYAAKPMQRHAAQWCSAKLCDSSREQGFGEGPAGKAGVGHFSLLPFTMLLMTPDRGRHAGWPTDGLLCSHLSQHGIPRRFRASASATVSARYRIHLALWHYEQADLFRGHLRAIHSIFFTVLFYSMSNNICGERRAVLSSVLSSP